jgi:DNA helicase-2/ATP-dependent DNA helicase PcrA
MVSLLPRVGEATALKLHGDIVAMHFQQGRSLEETLRAEAIVKRVPADARDDWDGLVDTLVEISEALKNNELPAAVTHHAIEGWYSGFIRTLYPNWDSRLDDLGSLESFAARFESFAEYLSQLVLLNSEASDKNVEAPDDTLRLSSVHQAKGLEFSVVIVIGLSEGMFPSRRAIEDGTLDEERRLFYVAVTRAKDELVMTYPLLGGNNFVQLTPSRFLEALPESTFELAKSQTQGATGGFGQNWGKGGFASGTGSKQSSHSQYRSASQKSVRSGSFSSSGRTGSDEGEHQTKSDSKKTENNAKKLFNW